MNEEQKTVDAEEYEEVIVEASVLDKFWFKAKEVALNWGLPILECVLLVVTASGMEKIYLEDQQGNVYQTKAKKVRKSKAKVISKKMVDSEK